MKDILQTWARLTAAREEQGFCGTSESLKVFRKETDAKQDKADFVRDVEEEVAEERTVHDEEADQAHRVALEARAVVQARRQRGTGEVPFEAAEEPLPEKPTFDRKGTTRIIAERLKRCRRPFGQPVLTSRLTFENPVTATAACPAHEQQRRARARGYAVYVKAVVNGKTVGKSAVTALSSDFSAAFGDEFVVRVKAWPQSVILQPWESRSAGLRDVHLTDVYAPVPAASTVCESAEQEVMEFSSDRHLKALPVPASASQEDGGLPHSRIMTGRLRYRCGWAAGRDGRPKCPPENHAGAGAAAEQMHAADALGALGAMGLADASKLEAWIGQAALDPNDPRNTALLQSMRMVRAQRGYRRALPAFR